MAESDRQPELEATMWLIILFIVLFVLALGGGGWGRSRYGSMSWSPAAIILVVAVVLFFTGHLSLHG
jgi:Sec-independent protein translocase protein TatA